MLSDGVLEFEPPLVVMSLDARFCEFRFGSGNEETFDGLAGGRPTDYPRVPEVTGLWQLWGLAGEGRQGREVVLFENKDVSACVYPDVGAKQGESEGAMFDWRAVNHCEHQVLPLGLPGLRVSNSFCPIPPVGDCGIHFRFWREVVQSIVPKEQEDHRGENAEGEGLVWGRQGGWWMR